MSRLSRSLVKQLDSWATNDDPSWLSLFPNVFTHSRDRPDRLIRYNSSYCLFAMVLPTRSADLPMRLYRGLPASADQPVALTIGNFDGVHRGHQAMLSRLCEAAEDLRLPSAVMTFDPHPREFFAPDAAPPRLSTTRTKLEMFCAFGVSRVYVARFDA